MNDSGVRMVRMKACTKCKKWKPYAEFSKHRLTNDGRAYQCKECNAKRARAWRITPVGIYTRIRGRALFEKKKPFDLSRKDFVEWYDRQPKHCVYCGISEAERL